MSNVGYATLTVLPSAKGFASALGGEINAPLASAGNSSGKKAGGGFVGAFKGLVGPAIAIAGSAMFGGFIKEAAAASDATDKFKSTMSFAGLDTSAIDKATTAAKGYADQTVYDLPTIQNMIAQLASNGVSDYTGLTEAAGNLNAVAGGNADTFKSVAMVMTQTAGAGKLTTENWNQMADAIPGAAGPLMKAMKDAGAYTGNFRDAMADGQITSDEFNAALMKLGTDPVAVEAARSTKTFEGAIGNLEASINSGLMGALDAIKPAATGVINLAANGVTGLVGAFGKIGPAAAGVWSILSKGDYKGGIFGLEEDSPAIGFLFDLRDAAKGVFDSLGPAFAGIIPQALQLATSFSPMHILFQALAPLLPTIVTMIGQLATALGPILGQALAVVTPLVSQVVSILSTTFAAAMPSVQAVLVAVGGAFGSIATAIMPLVGIALPLVSAALTALQPVFATLTGQVLPLAAEAIGTLVAAIGPVVSTIAGVLVPVVQALMPVVSTVFGAIANIIQGAMQAVSGVIQVVTGIISGNWGQVWTGMQNIVGGVWNTIGAVIRGAINVVGSVISAGLGLVRGVFSSVWSGILGFLSGVWGNITTGVSGMIGNVVNFFGGLLGKITGAIGNAGAALFSIGQNIIQGLLDGIGSMMGAIGSAILSLVPGPIVGVFKDLLGIHSPSRVFRGFGVNIGEGLILGIQDKYADVEKTVARLGEIPASAKVSVPTVAGGGVAGALAGSSSGASTAPGIVVHQTIQSAESAETVSELTARKLLRLARR